MKSPFRVLFPSLFLFSSACIFGTITTACAQSNPNASATPTSTDVNPDLRGTLAAHGVTPSFLYRAEIFGGLTHRELAQHDVTGLTSEFASVGVDAAKLVGWRGNAMLSMQMVHGTALNQDPLGASQLASNLDSDRYIKLIEAWYADAYWHERLGFKVGRQYADTDFGVNESAGDFLNSGYGVLPTAPMPTYPNPQFGLMGFYAPTSWTSFGAGVYRGDLLTDDSEAAAPLRKGVFSVAELKLKPSALSSVVRFGGWRQGGGAYRLDSSVENRVAINFGAYATVDYWPLLHSEEKRGPALFARWGWAPSDRNEIHRHLEGGIAFPAVFPQRKQDTFGLGFTQVSLTGALHETVIESYYKLQVNRLLALQPDFQWAIHAAGADVNRAVAGMRVTMSF
jgi:porin